MQRVHHMQQRRQKKLGIWANILPVVFMAALIAAAAITVAAGSRYGRDSFLFGGGAADFTAGWYYDGGSPASLPGRLRDRRGDGAITLVNILPCTLDDGSVLFIRSTCQSLSVIANGDTIYTWQPSGGPLGLSSHIVTLPSEYAGRSVRLQLQPARPGGTVRVYDVVLGNAVSVTAAIVADNSDTVILFFIMAVFCILMIVSSLLFVRQGAGFRPADLLYLSVFAALAAAWMLTGSELMLLAQNTAVTQYGSMLSLMLLPVPLLMFARGIFRRFKSLLQALTVIVLLNFFVCAVLTHAGVAGFTQTLFSSRILGPASYGVAAAVGMLEYRRHKRRELLGIPLGFGLFFLFSSIESIAFFITGSPFTAVLLRIGLTLFIFCVGFVILRRTFGEIAHSKSYASLTRSIPSGICRIESFETCRILFANDFYYKMFGYTPGEAKNAGFVTSDFTVLPEDLPAMKETIEKTFADNFYRVETEARHRKKNGEIIWVLSRYTLEPFGRGAITAVMIDITDRKHMEEKLRISEEEYRIASLHSNKMILRLDIKTRACHSQQNTHQLFGLPPVLENTPDALLESGIVAHDSISPFRQFFEAIYRGERMGSVVVSLFNRNSGEYGWYHFDFTSIFDDDSNPVQAIISFYDVTHQHQKELAYQRWQQSYNAIPKNAANYYEYNLSGDVLELEEGGMIPPIPESVPRRLSDIARYIASNHVLPEDNELWTSFMSRDRLLERYANGQYTDKVEFRRLSGGKAYWTMVSVQLIPDPYSANVKGCFLLEDIDAQKRAELILQERSTRDPLTGLLNRLSFIEQFNDILKKSDANTQHALIMLDIDNFKTINDTLGHAAGDALLVSIASKLKYALRAGDLCGRLGGDEFVICLKNMNLGKPLESRVNDLCKLICQEQIQGIPVSASFGIASFPSDGASFEELYEKSDIALYKVKTRGRGGFALYDPQLSFEDLTYSGRL